MEPLLPRLVTVSDLAAQYVCDGFHASVRMSGEPSLVVIRLVGAKVVEQEEGIAKLRPSPADRSMPMHPSALDRRAAFGQDLGPNLRAGNLAAQA
jgi:hypothetical protein